MTRMAREPYAAAPIFFRQVVAKADGLQEDIGDLAGLLFKLSWRVAA